MHQEDQQPGRRLAQQSDSPDTPTPLPSFSTEALASLRTAAARIAASAQVQVAMLYGWDEQRVGLRLPVAPAPVAPDGTTGPGPWTAGTAVELSLGLVQHPYLASIGYTSTEPLDDVSTASTWGWFCHCLPRPLDVGVRLPGTRKPTWPLP